MGLREQFPTMTDVRQLEQLGFSREQLAGLVRVKALYQRGAYHEANPEHNRQAFVRWLYLQGRLESKFAVTMHVRGRMGSGGCMRSALKHLSNSIV